MGLSDLLQDMQQSCTVHLLSSYHGKEVKNHIQGENKPPDEGFWSKKVTMKVSFLW